MTEQTPTPNLIETALRIVADYTHFIETTPDVLTCICDEKMLPHPKNRIVDACCLSMLVHQSTESREQLLIRAASLARFQPEIGESLHSFGIDPEKVKAAEIKSMPSDDFWKVATDVMAKKGQYEKLIPRVQKEVSEILEKMKIANRAYNRKFHPEMPESD